MRLNKSFFIAAVLVAAAPIVVYGTSFWGQWSSRVEDWASFATYLSGTVAVIFSGFGIVAVVQTLSLQQEQISNLESDERRRDFSLRLNELLGTLSVVLGETDIRSRKSGKAFAVGRDAYRHFYKKLKSIYIRRKLSDQFDGCERTLVRDSFDELYKRSGSDFGHYFRTLYHCVLLIERSGLSVKEKYQYFDLLSCRLSKFELGMLFYNCLGSIGERKFKIKVEEFSMLEHFDADIVIDPSHLDFFSAAAFQRTSSN